MTLAPQRTALPARPSVAVLVPRLRLVRIYGPDRRWSERRAFGPLTDARFDHQRPPIGVDPARSVWYASRALIGAVSETYGKRGFLDRWAGDRVVVARVIRALRLVDLVGMGARRYSVTQQWARAFYDSYPTLAGIRWRGRQTGSICVVLTDRARMRSLARETDLSITDPSVWPRIARAAHLCGVRIV